MGVFMENTGQPSTATPSAAGYPEDLFYESRPGIMPHASMPTPSHNNLLSHVTNPAGSSPCSSPVDFRKPDASYESDDDVAIDVVSEAECSKTGLLKEAFTLISIQYSVTTTYNIHLSNI
jgi:hypothetical protein